MKITETFNATIQLGFKEHYDGTIHAITEVEEICQNYCDDVGLCVTITPTKYIYKNGNEEGCSIGLINYPRFPSSPKIILDKAIKLSWILLKEFNQFKISIVCNDKTYMIEE